MNRKTATIDGNGRRTEIKYDLAGSCHCRSNDNNETLKAGYNPLGQLTTLTNNLGYHTQFRYDAHGLCNTTDPNYQSH
jgi:uncharacterized protein RhaS with RHS repeats